jgi:PKD repeat protein
MIAWNSAGSQTDMDIIYNPTMTSTLTMANLFSEVVSTYNINLIPEIGTSLGGGSDHSSFWRFGFPSILSIEDQGDFNPYYHKANDTPANTDLSYFTDFVKAALASFAHMTNCLLPSGHLEGHITSVGDDLPVEGAGITAKNRQEESFQGFSNSSGHYSLPLPAGVYTVTVSADGFIPAEMSNMSVFIGSTTSLDFALDPICNPITGLDFTWQPAYPFASREVSFTAAAQAVHPIHFAWDFGDAAGASGITATHSYTEPGIYTITLTASNICDAQSVSKDLTIFNTFWAFLPILVNGSSSP